MKPQRHRRSHREKKARYEATTWQITVNGKAVQCYSWGSGTRQALFVHGWSGRGTQCAGLLEDFLNKGYMVYALDLPAHGESAGKETNLFECAKAVKVFVEATGRPDIAICHSFGGIVTTYAKSIGTPISRWIMMGTPVFNQFLIDSFRQITGAGRSFEVALKAFIKRQFKIEFVDFGVDQLLAKLDRQQLMIIHDENDQVVPIELAYDLVDIYPEIVFEQTVGLGHKRILADEQVVLKVLQFTEGNGPKGRQLAAVSHSNCL